MDIKPVLQQLGLNDKEADVFMALLKTPGHQPASVIARKSDLKRVTAYKILMKLVREGLVTKTMRFGVAAFFIEDPDKRLEDLLEKKRQSVDKLNEQVLGILPEIKSMVPFEVTAPKMKVYEGLAGVIRAYEDTIVDSNTIYSFENIEEMPSEIKSYMESTFVPRRIEKGNFAYVLAPENAQNKQARKDDARYLREARFAPKNRLLIQTGVNIYGDKISFFSYDPKDMFGVVLESKAFATTIREIFQFCWEHSK
jgi:sugar-specific transcriptional regulator TrmB